MKKIFINKDDSVAEVVEKIISEPELEVTLVIPRDTVLDDSLGNFQLIKRESAASGKHIVIESVDDQVLNLARSANIESVHPLLNRKKRSSSLSDIVAKEEEKGKEPEPEEVSEEPPKISAIRRTRPVIPEASEALIESKPKSRRIFKPKILLWVGVPVAIIVAILLVLGNFRKAEIVISFKTSPFEYEGKIMATTAASKIDSISLILPAEVFTETKNLSQIYPASTRKNVSEKATGRILVYNSFSSAKQQLVVNTRFVTPDGKTFRLTQGIEVPGAQIKDGQIIPASIEASVIADKAGPEYNLENIARLSIPGFQGSPKYEKFYGSLIKTSGGFIGEKAVPTDKDVAEAKTKANETLLASLKGSLFPSESDEFKILDEAKEVKVTKTSINKNTDDKGNFSVFVEAELKALGFRDQDLKSLLLTTSESSLNKTFRNLTVDYENVKPNFEKGEMSFTAKAKGILTEIFETDAFKPEIAGEDVKTVREKVLKLPGLSEAKVSVWPSWVSRLPKNVENIVITIN